MYDNWLYLKKRNIKYAFILVPNKHTIYPEFLPKHIYSRFKRKYPHIQTNADQIKKALLERDKNFPIIDLRSHIKSHKNNPKNYILYDKTDTHWNGYGMKIAYEKIYEYLTKNLGINLAKSKFILEEKIINSGDLANMAGRYPQYKSIKASLKNKDFGEIKSSHAKDQIRTIAKNIYEHKLQNKDISLYKKQEDFKTFIQHDSFFRSGLLQPFIANSLNGESIFVRNIFKNNMLCKIQKSNIDYFKPDLVIHQMVERLAVKYCSKYPAKDFGF